MQDDFQNYSTGLTAPATAAEQISPSDTVDLAHATRGLYVGGKGNAVVKLLSGDTIMLNNLQPGVIYPIRISRVMASGTTATTLVGLR